jgi:hypothetical protein
VRYIDPQIVRQKLPPGWEARAKRAAEAVAAEQPERRAAKVNSSSQIWRDLKETLKNVSHNKCWYCESREIRSDNAVDHFRPKNGVVECPEHEGYWWLAFRWENYRFCCTFCNSYHSAGTGGGKATNFPLRDETRRAKTPADALEDEEPMLLDPMIAADPGMLWFDEDGRARANPVCCAPGSYPYNRVDISIGVYHLNHRDIVDQRKALCNEIRTHVEQADRHFKRYTKGDSTARIAFQDSITNLKGTLSAEAPYSSTARAMLMGLRGTHPFVEVVLAG